MAAYALMFLPTLMYGDQWYWMYPRLFLRGFAEWMFIIGVYGVMR